MPELPEVETVVRFLNPRIARKTIASFHCLNGHNKVIEGSTPILFSRQVAGQTVALVHRRGKYIILDLTKGHILIHLRMTGQLMMKPNCHDNAKHFRARFDFKDGTSLFFKDTRKFGRITYRDSLVSLNKKLGVEPLSSDFTPAWLNAGFKNCKRMLKPLLLDQKFIAGLGNIYVDEVLWAARIHPQSLCQRLGKQKVTLLHGAIVRILSRAIESNGTTIISFTYGEKSKGEYQDKLQVFARDKYPCFRCNTKIRKIFVAQRGTHFCPHCQRKR